MSGKTIRVFAAISPGPGELSHLLLIDRSIEPDLQLPLRDIQAFSEFCQHDRIFQ